ncbi:MAG: hypothetical protein AB7P37_21070 [Ramlibacter sp.]
MCLKPVWRALLLQGADEVAVTLARGADCGLSGAHAQRTASP